MQIRAKISLNSIFSPFSGFQSQFNLVYALILPVQTLQFMTL